ncbi:hypothetical protein FGSG_12127, partial [Fusarium graminearum PH-1]|uniref:hypothetical protein n=1 Tax=Gibberella zeae (strain ATCC MYA-4620 / CBS 123657 / FGSC 9075 / NRRL 31084 / PH-1) TaxID=229533 RepID=UPI00021F1836
MKLSPSKYLPVLLGTLSLTIANPSADCKCFPGDDCWPSAAEWKALNTSVSGNLIKTVPLGAPCHDPMFKGDVCQSLRQQWQNATIHCDPFQPRIRPCELGNYVSYAIAAETTSDVQNAIAFARANHIRLVIRNTGHDYLGRSTGAGALGVWTHHLKNIEFVDWDDDTYTGNAVKLGAGVQGFEVLEAARSRGLVVVGGECPTVGIAGGYSQGGGHSALSTSFGLSVDNVLSWE